MPKAATQDGAKMAAREDAGVTGHVEARGRHQGAQTAHEGVDGHVVDAGQNPTKFADVSSSAPRPDRLNSPSSLQARHERGAEARTPGKYSIQGGEIS